MGANFFGLTLVGITSWLITSLVSGMNLSCYWWWAWSFALCDNGCTTSHAPRIEHATFITALLLTTFVSACTSLYSCTSIRSMSFYFHLPAATRGVPMYTRILLASTHVRVSFIATSTFLNFHLRKFRLRWIELMHISVCCLSFTWIGTPRYLTFVMHGIPPMFCMLSLVRIWDLSLFIFKLHSGARFSSS